jgi:hypothetical protein
MWAMLITTGIHQLEQGFSSWWLYFVYAFQEQWQFGEGIILFVVEPILIIISALVAQIFCKLKPKTIWSAPGLLLGTYMFFWLHPVIYWIITGDQWEPSDGYIPTMYITMGIGQLLCAKRGFKVDWQRACWFALAMLAANYAICILALLLLMPSVD